MDSLLVDLKDESSEDKMAALLVVMWVVMLVGSKDVMMAEQRGMQSAARLVP